MNVEYNINNLTKNRKLKKSNGKNSDACKFLIIGGFYGCCLALFLRSISKNVILIEKDNTLLNRASRKNQARIHAGFHYPRSVTTAVKSNYSIENLGFYDAIVDDFQMLYAISKEAQRLMRQDFIKCLGILERLFEKQT